MRIRSNLPFPSLFFTHWDKAGKEMGVLVVKAAFFVDEGRRSGRYYPEQAELWYEDIYHGSTNFSSLRLDSDLVPFKQATDVYFNAYARSPEEKAREHWPVSFRVSDKLSYGFHVFGAREWQPSGEGESKAWELSAIEAMTELPLRYEYAYGGSCFISADEIDSDPYNPVGRGMVTDYMLGQEMSVPVPQIGLAADLMHPKVGERMAVCGCGPITKSWLPRLSLAGTFDETWRRERAPYMPLDFDERYWNGAPTSLQTQGYLLGNEQIEMLGLRHEPEPYVFELPGFTMDCGLSRRGSLSQERIAMHLDTLYCDVSARDAKAHWFSLTWRANISDPEEVEQIELMLREVSDKEEA